MEDKLKKLCDMLVDYSLEVKENDRVLITYYNDKCIHFIKDLIKKIYEKKASCFVKMVDEDINALIMENVNDNSLKIIRNQKQFEIDNYDCFINIRYSTNDYVNKNIKSDVRTKILKETKDIDEIRVNEKRWVLLNYPSLLDAYKAKMNMDEYFNYALDAMIIDYKSMNEKLKPLKELMEKTDKVYIKGPGTDLTFSIKNMPIIPCIGQMNIPDGEIYTAPIKDSVNGVITYNTKSPYHGNIYNNVKLEFKDGKIINASCDDDNESLNKIFDTDEGSRYIGEFSLGLNPLIMHPMGDILYDEKIIGSLHFTPGSAYENADNKNRSSIHWDMVLIQRKDYGGGEIYFDDVLIRKDGLFVPTELLPLNYNLE